MSTPSASTTKRSDAKLASAGAQGTWESPRGISRLAQLVRQLTLGRTDSTLVQLLRYGFVGGIAFLCDAGTLRLSESRLGLHYLVAAILGFVVGLLVNYWLSVYWVFDRSKVSSASVQFGVFALVGLVGLGLNELIMWALTDGAGWHYMLSKIGATVVVYLWNFFIRKKLLF